MRDSRGKTLRAFTSNLARKQNDGEYEKMMRKTSRNDGEFMVRSNRMVNTSLVLYCAAVVERWSREIVDLMKQLLRNRVFLFFFFFIACFRYSVLFRMYVKDYCQSTLSVIKTLE